METTRAEAEEATTTSTTSRTDHSDTRDLTTTEAMAEVALVEDSTKEAMELVLGEEVLTTSTKEGGTTMTTMLLGTTLEALQEAALEAMTGEASGVKEAASEARQAEEEATISQGAESKDLTTGESTMLSMSLMSP
jgi:hypothetical protein